MNEHIAVGVSAVSEPSSVLRGTGAAVGAYVGIARVLTDAAALEQIERGDVLVCQTMPREWFPIFSTLGALVMDSGGTLSDAATRAREHGIPAVVATGVGTQSIANGQRVAVDGQRGTVRLLS